MIVITGASSGVGLELARLYKKAGKKVVNISRSKSEAADINILENLREGPEIIKVAKAVEAIDEPIEAIINCIGVYNQEKFGKISEDEIKRLMSTNVKAPMLLLSSLIDRIKKDEADVLNVISKAGVYGSSSNPVYVASKFAERGFTLSLQEELKATKSRVISFCPGGINTGLFGKASADINTTGWMDPADIALFIKQILDLPKSMEVSEVLINRKSIK
ncbi:MAG TPA: SDR family NAD(P)-dependent oxidoreductase [Methylomirabilota bacterium]|nr:SDR family NAD(P)-dependent oxidoreductase [Methylomirabilota bacterium]